MLRSARAIWRRLTRREQRAVAAAAGVVFLAASYLLIWQPMRAATARTNDELPRLQQQVLRARFHVAALSARALRAANAAPATAPSLAELRALAARAQIAPAAMQGDASEAGRMRIRLDAVGGDALISLLDIAQRERGWRVAEAHIARLDGPGRVRAEIVLTAAPQ